MVFQRNNYQDETTVELLSNMRKAKTEKRYYLVCTVEGKMRTGRIHFPIQYTNTEYPFKRTGSPCNKLYRYIHYAEGYSADWTKVTCKKCLERKPK